MSQPAVFIDRDGTLIEDADYLSSPEEIRILPGSIPGLQRLHQAGYLIVIVTNQSAVARGLISEDQLGLIHERLIEQVETLGGSIDAVYYCPHHPTEGIGEYRRQCDCRKPLPGMMLRAGDELNIDLAQSYLVGDAWRDVEAALAAGVIPLKVPRPAGREEERRDDLFVLAEVSNISEAADVILAADINEVRRQMEQPLPPTGATPGAAVPGASTAKKQQPGRNAPATQGPFDRLKVNEDARATMKTGIPATAAGTGAARGASTTKKQQPGRDAPATHGQDARATTSSREGEMADTLNQVLIELKALRRRADSDGFSFTRTVAYILQIVAIGLGGLAPFVQEANRTLMLILGAILVQLIALTFFMMPRE